MRQRQVNLSGALNVRDLGGYETRSQRQVRWEKLFRADNLAALTPDDQQCLCQLGITCVIDLRSTAEVTKFPDRLPPNINYLRVPILDNDETESSITTDALNRYYSADARNGYRRMLRVYRRLVISAQPRRAYRQFFRILVNRGATETILFHCSSGKDRTGICTLLTLGSLGVTLPQIKRDYLLTNQLCLPRVKQRLSDARHHWMNHNFQQSIVSLSTVSVDYYEQALTLINGEFGGIQAYLHDFVGLSRRDSQALQQIYLTSDPV